MSEQIINLDSLVELSTDEQQLLAGGQKGSWGGGDSGGGGDSWGGGDSGGGGGSSWRRRCFRRCIRRCR